MKYEILYVVVLGLAIPTCIVLAMVCWLLYGEHVMDAVDRFGQWGKAEDWVLDKLMGKHEEYSKGGTNDQIS